jgi:hypothetical protein
MVAIFKMSVKTHQSATISAKIGANFSVPFCLLLKNYERYLLEILYATSEFHHPKHDIRAIPLNSMEVC